MPWLVVGLGNPGPAYASHRHNLGFAVVDALRDAWGAPPWSSRFGSLYARAEAARGVPVTLLEPQTFMNLSGDAVQPAAAFLKCAPGEVVVVHDELDVPWGEVRVKVGGGHAGHNGLRSILARLGTPEFVRVRVGIGRPGPDFRGDVAAWVLSGLAPSERAALPSVLERATDAVTRIVRDGVGPAMNATNARPAKGGPTSPSG